MVADTKPLEILKHKPPHCVGGAMTIPTTLVKVAFGGWATHHVLLEGLGGY
jgi:hypothetical protein